LNEAGILPARFSAQLFLDKFFGGSKVKAIKKTRINFCLTTTFAAVILLGLTTAAISQLKNEATDIQMSNLPITSAIEDLARQSGINYFVDPKLFASPNNSNGNGIPEPTLTFHWTNITPKDALSRVLKENGLVMIEDQSTGIAQITSTNQVANVVDASLLGSNANDVASTVRFQDVPLDEALKNLIEHGHINVVLDPKVSDYIDPADHTNHNAPLVSLRWENTAARQAIVALCEKYDLVIVKDSATGIIRIKPKD
jgi:hypothetical protein